MNKSWSNTIEKRRHLRRRHEDIMRTRDEMPSWWPAHRDGDYWVMVVGLVAIVALIVLSADDVIAIVTHLHLGAIWTK